MLRSRVALIVCRIIQFAFACVILGLSIRFYRGVEQAIFGCEDLLTHHILAFPVKWCRLSSQSFPSALFYSGVVGGFGLVDALIGLVFTGCLSFNVSLDICTMAFYLAAGINFVVVYSHIWAGHGGCDVSQKGSPCSGFLGDLICLFLAFACTGAAAALAIWDKHLSRSADAEEGIPA